MKTHEVILQGYEAECDGILVLGTEDSFGTERLHVTLGEDWDNLTITAVFTNGSSTEVIADAEGMILVPAEAVAESTGESFGRIVFKGTADGVQRISGDVLYIALPHGPVQGENSVDPTPDQFTQFIGMVSGEAERAEAAADRAEAAGDTVDPSLVKQNVEAYLDANPVQPTPIDTTLSKENEAADAKAVGDALNQHNTSGAAHGDIREQIEALEESGLTTQEMVSGIAADVKSTGEEIAALAESKVNVSDVVNALTSKAEDKPLSAAQGTALKVLVDGKAPAGYGLGSGSTLIPTDGLLSDYANNGWYSWSATNADPDKPFPTGELFSIKRTDGSYATQIAFQSTSESIEYIKVRKLKSGTWSAWEWVNPPMVFGTEYRTTERWQGKAVYLKAMDFGALPASGSKSLTLLSSVYDIIDWRVNLISETGANHTIPWLASGTYTGKVRAAILASSNRTLQISVAEDMSTYTATAVFKYIKD